VSSWHPRVGESDVEYSAPKTRDEAVVDEAGVRQQTSNPGFAILHKWSVSLHRCSKDPDFRYESLFYASNTPWSVVYWDAERGAVE